MGRVVEKEAQPCGGKRLVGQRRVLGCLEFPGFSGWSSLKSRALERGGAGPISGEAAQDEAAQRQAQEGDVQRQEGAEAGHAGGAAADHHGGAAHAGRGGGPDRGVRVRGHAPGHPRVSRRPVRRSRERGALLLPASPGASRPALSPASPFCHRKRLLGECATHLTVRFMCLSDLKRGCFFPKPASVPLRPGKGEICPPQLCVNQLPTVPPSGA
ncbi:single-pass membrane and coiled-coil domain-containing protein 4 isoform 1-T1 [Sarcophilus harrisii]